MELSRRGFIVASAGALVARAVPMVGKAPAKRVLTLVYDKSIGAMRAVDKIVR